MNRLFKVSYLLKKTIRNTGEFLPEQLSETHLFLSVSNDLNEIFTDLFDLHRHQGIIALEIISVEEAIEMDFLKEARAILYA